jgi:PTH2 family peptidyl-tRNA hydrolase
MNNLQQVIVMRKDLNMRKGKMIAQACHASVKSILENQNDDRVKNWIENNYTKICVSVNSEEELLSVYEKAKSSNMICTLVEDLGFTEFNGIPTLTCCSIGPATKDELQTITGDLKLL